MTTEKVGRVRRCRLGPRRLEAETAWIAQLPADAGGPPRPARRVPRATQVTQGRRSPGRASLTRLNRSSTDERKASHDFCKRARTRCEGDDTHRSRDPHRARLQRAPRPGLAGMHRPRAGRAVVGARQQARHRAHGGGARRPLAVRRAATSGVHGFEGRYREVTPPERIVQTFEWDGMPGHVVIETVDPRGPRRRPDEGREHVAVPHHRGARRHAELGHGGGPQPELRRARPAARQDRLRALLVCEVRDRDASRCVCLTRNAASRER